MYDPEQKDNIDSWQKFTTVFVSKIHSLTVVDVDDKTLKLSQQSVDGKALGAIKISK